MILNKTTKASERFRVVPEGMGGAGNPPDHYLNRWSVASGVDRGNGYQGFMAIDYALSEESWMPEEAKTNLRRFLKSKGVTL